MKDLEISLKNYSNILKNAYTYMGYYNINPDSDIESIAIECIKEIEELNSFKYIYQEFTYNLDFLNKNEAYLNYLNGSTHYYLIATTLGPKIDNEVKRLSVTDPKKMIIYNSCAAAYLEYMADKFEDENFKDASFRFCPGYSGTSIVDIKEIFKILKPEKLTGITLLESNLMVPEKSMVGIVGINTNSKKTCDKCLIYEKCVLRKEGLRCSKN